MTAEANATQTVHAAAAIGYSGAAQAYVSGRPGYPPEAVDWLTQVIGLGPDKRVLDLGAGTGKFEPVLQQTGATILALEPVDAMRIELARLYPDVEALSGNAQAIPLPDASLDAVVCAQAFHWFATPAALAEIHRVLKPGGVLGLIWNGRDESVSWVAALSEIIDTFEGDAPRFKSGAWRSVFPAPGFEPFDERLARNDHVGSAEQVLIQRTLSVSFIAALPADQQKTVETEVRRLIAATPDLADRSEIAFPYATAMFAFRRTSL